MQKEIPRGVQFLRDSMDNFHDTFSIMLLTIYSLIALFYWLFLTMWLLINGRKIKHVSDIQKKGTNPEPSVRIIIAAHCWRKHQLVPLTKIGLKSAQDFSGIKGLVKLNYS